MSATSTADDGSELPTSAGRPPLLPRAESPFTIACACPVGVVEAVDMSGTSLGLNEGDDFLVPRFAAEAVGMVPSDTPPAKAHAASIVWSSSPHRIKRHSLKPIHLPTTATIPSVGVSAAPASSLQLSSSFSHKLRRRLQDATEEGHCCSHHNSHDFSKTSGMTRSDVAAAAAATIVATTTGPEDSLKKLELLRRASLTE